MRKIRIKNFKGFTGRALTGLIFFSILSGISGVTAFGNDHGRFDHDRFGRGRFEHKGPDRYWHGHGRRAYWPYGYGYGYTAPIYAPRPVIYAPPPPVIYAPPPPGIAIFLPPIVIR